MEKTMEELGFDNILEESEVDSLFNDTQEDSTPEEKVEKPKEEASEKEDKEEKEVTTEVDEEELFESPESVGSEEDTKAEKDPSSNNKKGSSPHFLSSIAQALRDEGIFPDLNDDDFNSINEAEDFKELIEKQIQSSLDERQKRIDDALNYGVEPSEINKFENTIKYLDSLDDDTLNAETEEGETLRKNLIFQDFVNRGYSKERATREVQKSLNAGTDIDDAKEALNSNKEFFRGQYNELVKSAKESAEQEKRQRESAAAEVKKAIIEDSNPLGDIIVDKATRKRAFDNIAKASFKDPNTGEYLTALQKYERENRVDFIKNLGLIFTITNGFKDLDALVKGKVKKEVKKGLKDLERVLSGNNGSFEGNFNYINGSADEDSFIGKDWKLDI